MGGILRLFDIFQVYQQVLSEGRPLIDSLVASITAEKSALENIKSERELMTILNRINGVGWKKKYQEA